MHYFSYLVILGALAFLSLTLLLLLSLLDSIRCSSEQKITIIKLGLILLLSTPFFYVCLNGYIAKQIELSLPFDLMDMHAISTFYPAKTAQAFSWPQHIFVAYLFGFLLMLFRLCLSFYKASMQLKNATQRTIDGQLIYCHSSLASPISFGVLRTKIYFPQDVDQRLSKREIQLSLAHEVIHLEQKDSLWQLLSLIVQALLFFAPWIYLLHRRFMLEIEILCDKKTCENTDASIQEYGNLLLKMVSMQPHHLIFNNLINKKLKWRFIAMKTQSNYRAYVSVFASLFLLLVTSSVIAMTNKIIQNQTTFNINSKIFVDGKLLSSPRIMTRENQPASIFVGNKNRYLKIALIANNVSTKDLRGAIHIHFKINYQNGTDTMNSNPEFILSPHKEAYIVLSSSNGHSFEMAVTAERF